MSQQRIGRYQILEEIASGGQATVHRVWDTQTGGILALKVMHPHLTRDSSYIERFRREAAIASALNHPNITRVFEIGQEGDTHFMSMEYLPLSLHYLIQSQGKLPVDRAVHIAYQITGADRRPCGHPLRYLFHGHRPVSDANGRPPLQRRNPLGDHRLHREAKPTSLRKVVPNLPRGLDTVVARCLEKDPNRRYQTPALMAQALQQVMPSIVTPTPQPQAITPPQTQQPAPQTTPPEAPAGTNLCARCGAKLEPGQRYCTACGTAVTGPSLAPPTPPRPAPAAPPQPFSSTFMRAWEGALRTRRRGPLWARLLALTALVAVVGSVVYLTTPSEEPETIEPAARPVEQIVGTVGEQLWARELPGAVQLLAVGPEGEMYVAEESGEIHSVGSDGAERWQFGFSAPIVNAVLGSNNLLHVSTNDGLLLGLRASDGSMVYRSGVNVAVMTGTGPSGDLYAISEDGFLFRYPSDGGPSLWNLRVGQKVTAPPAVVDTAIFEMSLGSLSAHQGLAIPVV